MSKRHNQALKEKAMVELTWHGEDDTLARLELGAEKAVVKAGATVKADEESAKTLMAYSARWTLKGEEYEVQPHERAFKAALEAADRRNADANKNAMKEAKRRAAARAARTKAAASKEDEKEPEDDKKPEQTAPVVLTESEVMALATKEEVMAALESHGQKANDAASLDELKTLLLEVITAPKS